jgi:hypothetical protein
MSPWRAPLARTLAPVPGAPGPARRLASAEEGDLFFDAEEAEGEDEGEGEGGTLELAGAVAAPARRLAASYDAAATLPGVPAPTGRGLTLFVHAPPLGGALLVSPPEGIAAVTPFSLSTQGWSDADTAALLPDPLGAPDALAALLCAAALPLAVERELAAIA